MKAVGIVRKIDGLGRIVIPMELRRTLGLDEKAPMEIFVEGDNIIFRKYRKSCSITGRTDDLVQIGEDRYINRDVAQQVVDNFK